MNKRLPTPAPLPKAGNTEELERLQREIDRLEAVRERLVKEKQEAIDEANTLRGETLSLKDLLRKANDKIQALESINDSDKNENKLTNYVEIVALMPDRKQRPPLKMVDGIPAKRVIDEDGFCHDFVPVKVAGPFITEKHGLRHVLVGPMDNLTVSISKGLYTETVVVPRHSKRKFDNGEIRWIPVEVEQSEDKFD